MEKNFEGKVVIVTGGVSGIGKELVVQFARAGAILMVIDRNKDAGTILEHDMAKDGFDVTFEHADMANISQAKAIFQKIITKHSHLDYVINDAGVFMGGEIRDTEIPHWHKILTNNIFAVANGTHLAYQQMLVQGDGHIINLSSAAGLMPIPGMGIYGSTKYAIAGLTHALRNEAKAFHIKVSVVCPTIVDTPLYDTAQYNNVNVKRALQPRKAFQTPAVAAQRIIKGISRNKATIHTSTSTQLIWWLYRLSPSLYDILARKVIDRYRQRLRLDD